MCVCARVHACVCVCVCTHHRSLSKDSSLFCEVVRVRKREGDVWTWCSELMSGGRTGKSVGGPRGRRFRG